MPVNTDLTAVNDLSLIRVQFHRIHANIVTEFGESKPTVSYVLPPLPAVQSYQAPTKSVVTEKKKAFNHHFGSTETILANKDTAHEFYRILHELDCELKI